MYYMGCKCYAPIGRVHAHAVALPLHLMLRYSSFDPPPNRLCPYAKYSHRDASY